MKAVIEKELANPEWIDGIAQVTGPYYHIYSVDDEGNKTFVKTINQDIKEAAREAERLLDIDVLEVLYKENPNAFKSSSGIDWDKWRAEAWDKFGNSMKKH